MHRSTRLLLLLSLSVFPQPGAGQPARVAGPGDAPVLQPRELPPELAEGLDRHRAWAIKRAGLQRLARQLELLPRSAWSSVELTESEGELSFDAKTKTVSSVTKLKIKSNTNVLSSVYLYLEPLSGGSEQVADGVGALQTYDQGNGILQVNLRQAIDAGDTVELTLTRSGTPQCKSSFLNLVTCDIGATVSFSVGMAWQALLYDLSTYSLVYPDKATLELKVPSGLSAAASGIPAGVKTNPDGSKTHTFTNDYKGTFSVAAAPYSYGSTTFGGGKLAGAYLYSAPAQQYAAGWQQAAAEIVSFHAARFGSYDPPRVALAEIPNITGAAFGPLITVFIPSASLAYDPKLAGATVTLAHELGHQWFGGFIEAVDSYSPWLSEGTATFAEMEWTAAQAAKVYGLPMGPSYRYQKNLSYIYTVPKSQDVPLSSKEIFTASSTIYYTVTYTKGALVVGMMRYLLGGDAPFFSAMRAYRKDHEGKGATVTSFAASLKASSGVDLTSFLTAWAYKAGYPTYSTAVKRTPSGAEITIKAERDGALPVEIEVVTADGKQTRSKLPLAAPYTEFKHTVQSASEVLSVRVDPDYQIVGRKRGALAGDIHLNGEVDGIDLIYAAWAVGQQYDPQKSQSFAEWADLELDGIIDDKDLATVKSSFGTKTGDK